MEARQTRRATFGVGIAVALLATASFAGAVLVSGRSEHPREWDPRVTELVAFVERERGLTFDHPVRIDFLDDAAFRKEVTETEAPDEQEKAEIESAEAMLRAVGLLSGEISLLATAVELAGEGIVGLYSPEDERVLIRGEDLDDQRRSTLVHELTHALQDQHFDIGTYRADDARTSGEMAAHTAAVEADAEAVEDSWRATLPAAARQALDEAEDEEAPRAAGVKGIPEVFVEMTAFPYVFGPELLRTVVDKDGAAGRNRLFTEPPRTEEHILLPGTYLGRQQAQQVDAPALKDGEKLVKDSESDVGMLSLLIMLAERIDFGVAWPAVQGWAGDSIVAFERSGSTCVRADVAFDAAAQAERFAAAFGQWSAGRPANHLQIDRMVVFESCDPGVAATGRAEGHVSGIEGLALRKMLLAALQEQDLPREVATCTVDGLLERMTADRIAQLDQVITTDPRNRAAGQEIQRTMAQVVAGCR